MTDLRRCSRGCAPTVSKKCVRIPSGIAWFNIMQNIFAAVRLRYVSRPHLGCYAGSVTTSWFSIFGVRVLLFE